MASKTGGGSGSGKSMEERGKGPEYIWPKHGEGNENRVKKEKTLDEEDEERCAKLTLNWEGRLSTEEMNKYPPPPPGRFTDGRSQRVQTAAEGYWQSLKEGCHSALMLICIHHSEICLIMIMMFCAVCFSVLILLCSIFETSFLLKHAIRWAPPLVLYHTCDCKQC